MPAAPLAVLAADLGLAPALVDLLRDSAFDRSIARRLVDLDEFTSDEHAASAPEAILVSLPRAEWAAMSRAERRVALVASLREDRRERKAANSARRRARDASGVRPATVLSRRLPLAPPEPLADVRPAAAEPSPRAVVPCACGCGELFPAKSDRAVVRFCDEARARRDAATSRQRRRVA